MRGRLPVKKARAIQELLKNHGIDEVSKLAKCLSLREKDLIKMVRRKVVHVELIKIGTYKLCIEAPSLLTTKQSRRRYIFLPNTYTPLEFAFLVVYCVLDLIYAAFCFMGAINPLLNIHGFALFVCFVCFNSFALAATTQIITLRHIHYLAILKHYGFDIKKVIVVVIVITKNARNASKRRIELTLSALDDLKAVKKAALRELKQYYLRKSGKIPKYLNKKEEEILEEFFLVLKMTENKSKNNYICKCECIPLALLRSKKLYFELVKRDIIKAHAKEEIMKLKKEKKADFSIEEYPKAIKYKYPRGIICETLRE